MIAIDTIVSIKSGDEYGGKYAGKLGIVKRFTDDRVGVEFAGLKNHASKYGLFWFDKENVTPSLFNTPKRDDGIIPAALAKAFLNFTFGAPRASLGVKQVIFSGPKTIVFWLDGTKTIVSCGEGDHNDPYLDITAPLYWWKEFDTYKVGTVANSCSTMHKITDKPFELDDFSHEHLGFQSVRVLKDTIKVMNDFREEFIKDHEKENWWQLIQLLPSSYNQKRTVMLNYEVLAMRMTLLFAHC